MDIELLKEVLAVPTVYNYEKRMIDFLISWGVKNSIPVILDSYGNVYLKKGKVGEGEYFPCVIAHMDTVQEHRELVEKDVKLKINEKFYKNKTILTALNPLKQGIDSITGVGGDDKAGIAICLDIISKTDNIIGAFFKGEEIGCLGSRNADVDIFNSVGYAIEFDAPGSDWLSYVSNRTQLFNREFFKLVDPILLRYGISNIRDTDPFTDVFAIKRSFDFNCMNLFAGYYDWHSATEFVVYEDTVKASNLGLEIIQLLGNNKYKFKHKKAIQPISKILFD
jgi:di/tripeptidase